MRKGLTLILILLVTLGPALIPSAFAVPTRGFLSTRGTSIIDSSGQVIVLRGVNYPGYETDEPRLHNWYAYNNFAQLGFNVVRLPISWAHLEPQPGMFNMAYLSYYVDQDVRWAKSAGVYIILDMHQYYWAHKFGGMGVPVWSVQRYAPNELGLRQAVSDFWTNSSLQGHLITVWSKIAQHYANESTVVGYDILNEPWVYTSIVTGLNATHVDTFYLKTIQAIRAVDSYHIIFLEPANVATFKLPTKTNIVWSPHFYALSFSSKYYPQNATLLESDMAAKFKTFVLESGIPMWVGEFGAFMPDKSSCAKWTQDALNLFNKYQVGWAWWAYYGRYAGPIPNQLNMLNA